MKKHLKICFVILFSLSLTTLAFGKQFRNSYVSFEMNENWKCTLEHTEYVCRSENAKESKEALIVLTAKEVGPSDSFDAYTNHLKTPQTNALKGSSQRVPSKVFYAPKQAYINNHTWIDGLHIGSEVPNYYTRYLATIKDQIAVLVTFSAHKLFYTKYSQDFYKTIMSLRVIASKNLLASSSNGIGSSSGIIGQGISGAIPNDMMIEEESTSPTGKGEKTKNLFLALGVILAGLGIYIFTKSKKA